MPSEPRAAGARAASAAAAEVVADWLACVARVVHERRTWLTELDAAIGDGDHGINLDRGLAAVRADLEAGAMPDDDAGHLLAAAGRRLLGVVGGASGALYGRALMTAGSRLSEDEGSKILDPRAVAEVVLAGAIDGIAALGRAVAGDKTMLDALLPALATLRAAPADEPVVDVLARVAAAAEAGAQATIPLVARKGRASYLGGRSAGHLDPGAASSAIFVRCLADVVGASVDDDADEGAEG
ncbi:MAG TPA: dihydroxyacetone kinase subunit DhaL [Candidatus Limnocylindrales bacterium]|nr:dihydroxyacetone kinase subunit DhaL [Candidatus Limnocylindrales bacterium]